MQGLVNVGMINETNEHNVHRSECMDSELWLFLYAIQLVRLVSVWLVGLVLWLPTRTQHFLIQEEKRFNEGRSLCIINGWLYCTFDGFFFSVLNRTISKWPLAITWIAFHRMFTSIQFAWGIYFRDLIICFIDWS